MASLIPGGECESFAVHIQPPLFVPTKAGDSPPLRVILEPPLYLESLRSCRSRNGVTLTVHFFFYILGFSRSLFPFLVNPDGVL